MDATSADHDPPHPAAPVSPPNRGRFPRLALLAAAAIVAVDQVTKWLAVKHLDEPVDLVWTLRLALTHNTGTAFSLGLGLGPFIAVAAVVIVVALARLGRTVVSPLGTVALGLVMGGALGNLVDRVFRARDGLLDGAVIDFIDLQWWPVFNVADMAIVIGAVLLACSGFGAGDRAAHRGGGPENGGRKGGEAGVEARGEPAPPVP